MVLWTFLQINNIACAIYLKLLHQDTVGTSGYCRHNVMHIFDIAQPYNTKACDCLTAFASDLGDN